MLGKRGLLVGQKRPTYRAKETYVQGKRDLLKSKRDLVMVPAYYAS